MSTSVTGSAATTIQAGGGSALASRLISSRNVLALAKNQRAVEPVEDQAGQPLGLRMHVHVVVALEPVHAPEHRSVGPPRPAEDVEDRQRDRDRDPGQHAQQGDAEERRDRQQELGLALPPQPHRVPGMSASDKDAVMTTAASAG